MGSSKSVVLAALVANGAIAILKFVGWLLTGSPSMLSETYHSISDTGNQVFLLIGIRFGAKEASQLHPFGYGKAQFFYSFLVSVLLFGIAGWESAKHGYEKLVHGGHGGAAADVTVLGQTFDPIYVNYAVLLGGIVFESWAFLKANKELRAQMDENDWSGYREAFRRTSDVTTLTAFTEDTIALAGLVLALLGNLLGQITGNAIYDAAAAFLIGIMLMGFAIALAWENKRLLLGESLHESDERPLRQLIEEADGVEEIVGFRSVYFGPERVLVTADVAFEDGIGTQVMDEKIGAIETQIQDAQPFVKKVYIEPET
jgi:cation diffusion facilitator family transporter